jgi:hypothetical protein
MLLMERAGPVTETQRKCLEEAEKATTRVLGVVERLEILARWDQRPSQAKNAAVVALDALVRESTSALPIEMALDVRSDYGDEHVFGDGRHIRLLIDSVIRCVRSSIDGPVAVSVAASPVGETSERWVVVCAPDQLALLQVPSLRSDAHLMTQRLNPRHSERGVLVDRPCPLASNRFLSSSSAATPGRFSLDKLQASNTATITPAVCETKSRRSLR